MVFHFIYCLEYFWVYGLAPNTISAVLEFFYNDCLTLIARIAMKHFLNGTGPLSE